MWVRIQSFGYLLTYECPLARIRLTMTWTISVRILSSENEFFVLEKPGMEMLIRLDLEDDENGEEEDDDIIEDDGSLDYE